MTTIVAFRSKKGVYIASDSRVTRFCNDKKVDNRTYLGQYKHKFIRAGYGFYGISGDLDLGALTEYFLYHTSVFGKSVDEGLEFESFASIPLEASKETIERSVRVFFTSVFSYINNSKHRKEFYKANDISFMYIDKNRIIKGKFSTKTGLYNLEIKLFAKDEYYIWGIGGGSKLARKYVYNHFWDEIGNEELLRRAIRSTSSQDYGTGGKINISAIWNKENNEPYREDFKNKNLFNDYKKTWINQQSAEIRRSHFGANIARVYFFSKLTQILFLNYDLRDHFIAIVNYAKEYYDADVYSILPLNLCARSG